MNLRRRGHADSLELLLNTMCNTFGGIVMISLVMALLAGDTSSEEAASSRAANWQQQIDQATAALGEASRLQATLAANQSEATDRLALSAEVSKLAERVKADQQIAQSNRAQVASMPVLDPDATKNLLERKSALANELRAANEQLERFKQAHGRTLRLPRERATGKKPFYFIVRYGRIYPIQILLNNERSLNTETIEWSETAEGRAAMPRREIPPNNNVPTFARQIRDLPIQTYSIHFLVYEDSFPAFLNARQLPLQAGYDTGWEFLPSDRPVLFSSGGEAPPAL